MWKEVKLQLLKYGVDKIEERGGRKKGHSSEGNRPGGFVRARYQGMHTLKVHQGLG